MPRMRPLLFFICLLALPAFADLGDALTFGPHRVGFEEREGVSVWYPAASSGAPLTFGDYLGPARQEFEAFLSGAGLSREGIRAYVGARMTAVRDARPSKGTFPLILVAQGNQHAAADQAVLCEYLASHGFVVATTPSPMLVRPMTDAEQIGEFAELQAAELRRAVRVVSAHHRVDATKIAVVGHSFGSRAALLLAMSHESVRAIVSLDGGIGSSIGVAQMRAARSFRPGRVPPLLHLYETEDAFVQSDPTFLQSAGSASLHTESIRGMHHVHFSSLGFAAASIPELQKLTRAPADVGESTEYIARRTLAFVSRYLR